MKKTNMFALLTTTTLVAFDNEAGWKKMDGDKLALDGDGNPIWIAPGGAEQSVKGDTIANLNREAKQHRTAKEDAERQLAKYRDDKGKLIDPDVAKSAIDKISKIDAKQLIDAGEVDRVRDEIRNEFTTQLTEKDQAIAERDSKIDNMLIDQVFNGSEFIAKQVNVPRDFFQAGMRQNFKVEDGKVVAYDRDGNRLMSKKAVGEYATPDEAIELLIERHPQKDMILKAPDGGGTGGNGGGGQRGNGGATVKRADFDAAPPHQQAAYGAQVAKGEITIVD